ncbi:monovalent cation:H+ antiporter-2, CPA2 family isoform 1 [Galdieria sulphuraria]|uniref:Monovalent cation:H+ antiporter-2, CPA2 family isoform 1 n=1 Tax=Galdieria sulphuraria TaxID=130081 RepID=M2XFK8_GALSU|nr:monovalent cation:H+ antiporter-2, CPA2 family isoform 1 [Galdieria sulphuraria]EME28797.1 monovalent cation:H+ antiporter-2, CPA2 family isoform 1 [Galdieria sulphuraria]|eukprot:XP_005705317.1 monovalent cation:H+ antiporter-2, CPA2 family isoform 1 [Galdieria sulphuraria]
MSAVYSLSECTKTKKIHSDSGSLCSSTVNSCCFTRASSFKRSPTCYSFTVFWNGFQRCPVCKKPWHIQSKYKRRNCEDFNRLEWTAVDTGWTSSLQDTLELLAATVAIVPVFKRINLSPVLGFLLSGVILGPHGFRLVKDVEDIKHLADFGVLFLLFEMGLELSIDRLRKLRKYAFGLGSLQMLITGSLFWFISHSLGASIPESFVIGGALAMSSSAFVLQLLGERGERQSKTGLATFGILLLQDVAVVPLLVVLPLMQNFRHLSLLEVEQMLHMLGMTSLKALAVLNSIVLIGGFLLRRLFQFVSGSGDAEAFTATVLLTVLGTGWLTGQFGLSMTLGAFVAGVLLAESNFRNRIKADTDPFRGLLLGLFFITTGMSIDLHLALEYPIQLCTLIGAIILIKSLVVIGLSLPFGLSLSEAVEVGLLLGQGGEFAFVLFALASNLGILPEIVNDLLIAAVVCSMALTPFLADLGTKLSLWIARQRSVSYSFTGVSLEDTLETPEDSSFNGMIPNRVKTERKPVVLCGFGPEGRMIGRMLMEKKITFIAVDKNKSVIRDALAEGLPCIYGDLFDPSSLRSDVFGYPDVFVITSDDIVVASKIFQSIRSTFPEAHTFALTPSVKQKRQLRSVGVEFVFSESYEASIQVGGAVLEFLGLTKSDVLALKRSYRTSETVQEEFAKVEEFSELIIAAIICQLQERMELPKSSMDLTKLKKGTAKRQLSIWNRMKNERRANFTIRVSPKETMRQYASHSHQRERPRNYKLQSSDFFKEKQIGIYEGLKFLSKKFSRGQPSSKALTRFYEVSLNLNGLVEKEAPNQEDTAERVSEVVFILGTLGVSDLKTKRIEGLCDKLLVKDDIAVSILFLLLQLTSYENIQKREQETSLERFFKRKSHRRTMTLAKDTFRKEALYDLVSEPKDLSKFHWRHNRKFSLQLETLAESTGVSEELQDHIGSSYALSLRSQPFRRNAVTSCSNSHSIKDVGKDFDEKQNLEGTSMTLPKSIFDFTEKMYQTLYCKHFGSRSKSWIPPNHPLIFESAIWSLISNPSFLMRKNPLGGFEPVAARLQPCARSILAEFGTIATKLFEMGTIISHLREKNHPIFQGFAKALWDEMEGYSNNILPLIRKTRYKVHFDEQENLPIFGLMQRVRRVTTQLHECMAIIKALMPYGETDPYEVLLGLYYYQKEHIVSDKKESLYGRLFFKVLISYLFSLRRIALYGSQFCFNDDDSNNNYNNFVPQASMKLFENMLPMKIKFMVDKAAYGVDILWSINPQHPFFSSNRESLCTVPSFDSFDFHSLEQQLEEYFEGISKTLMEKCNSIHHQNTFVDTKSREHERFIEKESTCKKVEPDSDDELSWLSSESDDLMEPTGLHDENVTKLSTLDSSKHNCSREMSRNILSANVSSLWESSVTVKSKPTSVECETIDTPFDNFVAELGLLSIRGIYYHVQQYLWWLMEEEIEIFDHFRAVRDYLLLNRGDFFLELCHSVYSSSCSEWFMGGTEAEARLHLAFEQAILSSSASWDSRIRYFEFLMDKDGNSDNTNVYSQILLQWKPSNLVESALFDSSTLEVYSHIFHFAFKLKSASHILRQLYSTIPLIPLHWQGLQRKAQILRFQLMQFVNALLQFYEHGLLEGSWFRFFREANKCNDIWQMRNLHLQFLDEALSYIFGNHNPLASDVNRILEEIIIFELDTRRALRKSNVSNIAVLGRRIEGLSFMLYQFYDKVLLSDKKMKVRTAEWTVLITYFGINGE